MLDCSLALRCLLTRVLLRGLPWPRCSGGALAASCLRPPRRAEHHISDASLHILVLIKHNKILQHIPIHIYVCMYVCINHPVYTLPALVGNSRFPLDSTTHPCGGHQRPHTRLCCQHLQPHLTRRLLPPQSCPRPAPFTGKLLSSATPTLHPARSPCRLTTRCSPGGSWSQSPEDTAQPPPRHRCPGVRIPLGPHCPPPAPCVCAQGWASWGPTCSSLGCGIPSRCLIRPPPQSVLPPSTDYSLGSPVS